MEKSTAFLNLFAQINWLWYSISVITAFAAGAVWFTFIFQKSWIRVFKIDISEKGNANGIFLTMFIQLFVTALFGLIFFILVHISILLAILVLIAFCGWQKGTLKFRYSKWIDYFTAAIVEAGYTFVVGMIFILFAMI